MAIKLETIETLRAKIKDAPEVSKEKRNVSKQEAIRELKRDIESMQKRGYTIDDIAKFFTEAGLQITTPTLKSYLQRIKTVQVKTPKPEVKKPEVFADAKKATTAPAKAQETKAVKPADKGGFEVRPDSDI